MLDLLDFKRGQIVGAYVTKNAELFGVAGSTGSKVMIAFEEERKTSSFEQNSGRKRKFSERERRSLKQIVWKDLKNTAPKITAELDDYLENPAPTKKVRIKLHKTGFHGRAAIRKPY